MSVSRQFSRAGSIVGLPFLLLAVSLVFPWVALPMAEDNVPSFQEFESSCIDLASYDAKAKQLTVRFVNRNITRFYRYSNVPAKIWNTLRTLNETGGVGEYLNDTVVRHPEQFPYEEVTVQKFRTIPKKKKAGDSK